MEAPTASSYQPIAVVWSHVTSSRACRPSQSGESIAITGWQIEEDEMNWVATALASGEHQPAGSVAETESFFTSYSQIRRCSVHGISPGMKRHWNVQALACCSAGTQEYIPAEPHEPYSPAFLSHGVWRTIKTLNVFQCQWHTIIGVHHIFSDRRTTKPRICWPYHCGFQIKAFGFLVLLIGFSESIVQLGVGYSGAVLYWLWLVNSSLFVSVRSFIHRSRVAVVQGPVVATNLTSEPEKRTLLLLVNLTWYVLVRIRLAPFGKSWKECSCGDRHGLGLSPLNHQYPSMFLFFSSLKFCLEALHFCLQAWNLDGCFSYPCFL